MRNLQLAFLLFSSFLCIQATNAQEFNRVLHDARVDVVYLASDYLEGRATGTKGEALAAEYIAARFEEVGLTARGNDGSWFQKFSVKEKANPHQADSETTELIGKNVIGFLDNQAANTIIVGAHYDHLGMGEFGSRHTGEKAIHNGADDNASGVAAMIRIAAYLKTSELKANNYLFIAFSGEEKGLFGSAHFAKNDPTIDLTTANYMINMDMIGRLNEEKILAVNGVGTSPSWKTILPEIKVDGIKIKTTDSGVGPSDHTQFYLKSIPVLHFFTGQHTDYHKPEDDSHLVNYEGIISVSDYIIEIIKQLNDEGKITFTKTKDNDQKKAAAFKVTLGVMPDYVYDGTGMRIDAVIDGRVAAKAGLKDGDVVIKIGETEVKDIYGYMEGLSKYKKGDTTKVTVLRKKKELVKDVTF